MPQLKFHGATLDQATIAEFYPKNATHPDFEYFKFEYEADAGDEYHLKASAMNADNSLIKQIHVSKDNPVVPLDITSWDHSGVSIGVTNQLSKLGMGPHEEIKEMRLQPKKYKNNFVGYHVTIKIDNALRAIEDNINPSPPATVADNTWPN